MSFTLDFLDEALEDWKKLDNSVREQLRKKLERRLDEPRVKSDELSGNLAGHYKIRSDRTGHRLIYVIDGECVLVTAVGKRAGKAAYKVAFKRLY